MSDAQANHPHASYVDTREWQVIDRALSDLVQNRDLVETTRHEYLVGFRCKSLLDHAETTDAPSIVAAPSDEEIGASAIPSGVSLAEIRSKLLQLRNLSAQDLDKVLSVFPQVVPFTHQQAVIAGELHRTTLPLACHLGTDAVLRSLWS